MNELRGSCHCGNVEFTLFTEKSTDDFVPRRCSCSMCRRHGASYISDPDARLALRYRDRSLLSTYKFGHGTAQWIICSKCGVLTAVLCEIEGHLRAVVRVQSMVARLLRPECRRTSSPSRSRSVLREEQGPGSAPLMCLHRCPSCGSDGQHCAPDASLRLR